MGEFFGFMSVILLGFMCGTLLFGIANEPPYAPKFSEQVDLLGKVRVIEDQSGHKFYLFYDGSKVVKLEKKN